MGLYKLDKSEQQNSFIFQNLQKHSKMLIGKNSMFYLGGNDRFFKFIFVVKFSNF